MVAMGTSFQSGIGVSPPTKQSAPSGKPGTKNRMMRLRSPWRSTNASNVSNASSSMHQFLCLLLVSFRG